MKDNNSLSPSLLELESRGGDTAGSGFDFQSNLILVKIPYWLSYQGFTAFIQEAISDIEAKFFVPGQGMIIEAIEAKNRRITPNLFWQEIERFQNMDQGSPGTYRWFTLSCIELSDELKPLVNSLRRIRGPYHFYPPDSGVNENSYKDYLAQVRNIGKDEETAKFLFHKVRIETNWGSLIEQASGIFQQQLVENLPQYADVPSCLLHDVYTRLLAFVQSRKNKPIMRLEVEDVIQAAIEERYHPSPKPIIVKTSIEHETELNTALCFDWNYFFGGKDRNFPPNQEWNTKLLGELIDTKKWILNHLRIRRIRLTGNRRLSSSLAFGAIFSAVTGFTIEMEYRGDLWATDSHPTSSTPEFHWISNFEEGTGERLVVTIGIIRDIASEVKHYLKSEGNLNPPLLNIKSDQPITSDEQANLAVQKLKDLISQVLLGGKFPRIALFFAGPSHVALFLGHRLNATAPVQCYEWVNSGEYVPTCLLRI